MNTDRLKHLQDVLWRVVKGGSPVPFNMSYWALHPLGFDCATAACAFGHAALDPEFQRQGLGLERVVNADKQGAADGELTVVFQGESGWNAARRFFGIGSDTCLRLFAWEWYGNRPDTLVQPLDVMTRVQQLLDLGEAEFVRRIEFPLAVFRDPRASNDNGFLEEDAA